MKKYILPVILLLIVLWFAFDKVTNIGLTKEFKLKQDSLVKAVDSMQLVIVKEDKAIDSLNQIDSSLQYKVDHQKAKVVKVKELISEKWNEIEKYNTSELVGFYYNRYPKDTVTEPIVIAAPVLSSAAKDLVELDGDKQILVLKDSSIATLETRVSLKDSVINKYISKETTYKNIVNNQNTQIKDWKFQYNSLQLENAKLKTKNKFTKIGAGLIAGGLVYLMIAK